MSSPDRSRRQAILGAVLLALPGLAGCNLRPLYGGREGEVVTAELAAIDIRTAQSELAQYLGNQLEDALNPAGLNVAPDYELLVQLEQTANSLAIQLDSTVTRYDLYLLASFSLRRKGEAQPLLTSAVRRVATYNVERQPYATLAARRDAERRAAVEVSQEIRTRLALYFVGRGRT